MNKYIIMICLFVLLVLLGSYVFIDKTLSGHYSALGKAHTALIPVHVENGKRALESEYDSKVKTNEMLSGLLTIFGASLMIATPISVLVVLVSIIAYFGRHTSTNVVQGLEAWDEYAEAKRLRQPERPVQLPAPEEEEEEDSTRAKQMYRVT